MGWQDGTPVEASSGGQPAWMSGTPVDASEPSVLSKVGRQLGLTARAGIKGVLALPALAGDAVGMDTTAALDRNLTRIGLPEAENATERVVQDVAGGMAGQGGFMKAGEALARSAGPVASKVGELLTAQRGLQTAGAATGTGAAGITRESGGGPVAQTVAGVAGAVSPIAATAGAPMAVRGIMRGGDQGRQTVAENIKLFDKSGYGTPTVGQASEGRLPRAIESALSKTPGSAGRMADTAESGGANLGAKVEALADNLSPRATSTKAGAGIEKGVRSFVDRFKGEQTFLYEKLDTHIPKDTQVDMTNTVNKLAELNADIPGAPALSRFFKNSTIQAIEGAMKSDTADFTTRLPYEALKKLRTLVGSELENTNLTSDVPRSKWKTLYAALSQDLGEAAKAGGPNAQKAFERANTYTRAGHERIGTYLDRVAGKDTVEKVFQAAVSPSEIREGASTVNAVLKTLDPDARNLVKAAFLKRLGVATAGKQNEAGEIFSPETFLTNWNKISPEAKMTLFSDSKGTLRADLDKIAKVAANLRSGSKVFANPSGTQQAISSQMAGGGALIAVLTGNVGVAGAIGTTALSANLGARLMTNPKFVKWLAKATQAPTGAIPAELNTLAQMDMEPDDQAALQEFVKAARKSTIR